MIKEYGIPNRDYPHCNRELKLNPFKSLMNEMGLRKAKTAIGLRVDEIDRMSIHAEKDNLVYPLIKFSPTKKEQIIFWWKEQSFV